MYFWYWLGDVSVIDSLNFLFPFMVHAVALCKNTVVNFDMLALMKTLYGLEQPNTPMIYANS